MDCVLLYTCKLVLKGASEPSLLRYRCKFRAIAEPMLPSPVAGEIVKFISC